MYKKLLFYIIILILLFTTQLYARRTIYRPAMFTDGTYYQADYREISERELENQLIYVELTYNSNGKLIEEQFFIKGVIVAKRIYSTRFEKVLREESYKWDSNGNKTIYELKNYYDDKNIFREKSITSTIKENSEGKRKGVYVEYTLFSVINNIEVKRITQISENGRVKYNWIYYYDEYGTIIVIEERDINNNINRIGRPDYSRLMIGIDNTTESIVWRKPDD